MESSNTPELAPNATTETASPVESSNVQNLAPTEAPVKQETVKDAILSRKGKESAAPEKTDNAPADKTEPVVNAKVDETQPPPQTPAAPKYEPNFKFKAFGKEKEIPEMFRGLIKDQESEKQVREVFTRAEAFDDMKGRHENLSREHSTLLNNFTALDRDVRKATGFLNSRDYDNFFAMMRVSDADLLTYLQNKAQYMQDPALKQQYQQQVQSRANEIYQKEQVEALQSERQQLAVQHRTMQLDMTLSRPDIAGIASAWDKTAGEVGAFRQLVTQEAANYYHFHQQDLSAEQAVQLVLQRYGKFVPQGQAPQAPQAPGQMPGPTQGPMAQAPQAPQAVAPDGKPVIPTIQGQATSPVKKVVKSLDDIKRLGKELQREEFARQSY